MCRRILILGALATLLLSSCRKICDIVPGELRCEYLESPAIDIQRPRLSWIDEVSDETLKNVSQSAYRIVVASSGKKARKGDADIWDSGKVGSAESHLVEYGGPEMVSGRDYYWTVTVWDGNGRESRRSPVAKWTTGIMDPSQWKAAWIGAPWEKELPGEEFTPAPVFRKTFGLDRRPVSAKAFVSGLGYFDFSVNGMKAGDPDERLVPAMTDYTIRPDNLKDKPIAMENNFRGYRAMYMTYDVTGLLNKGTNELSVLVGNGFFGGNRNGRKIAWYGTPRLLLQLEMTFADGTRKTLVSDTSWKVARSPIVKDDLYDGEIYDANLESPVWENVVERSPLAGTMTANTAPTDKILERLPPVSLERQEDGSWKVDFGKVISGWIAFKGIKGAKGDTLKVYFPSDDGHTRYNGTNEFIFKDSTTIDYAPRFTWFSFRDAVISGVGELSTDNLEAQCVGSDVPVISEFHCSEPMLEKILTVWKQTQIDNMHGAVASDCPHRERAPYTGDGQLSMPMVLSHFDAAAFYKKWIEDIRLSQDTLTGYVPNGAPWEPICGGGMAWGAAIDIMPWEFHLRYGDNKILEDNYFAMTEYLRYLDTWELPDGTLKTLKGNPGSDEPLFFFNLGDWVPPYGFPENEVVYTFYYWYCTDIVSKAAKALGKDDDAIKYAEKAARIREAFLKRFYKPEGKTFGKYGANVFALAMGLPESCREDVVKTLRDEIMVEASGHVITGMVGSRFLYEVLSDNGLEDVAASIITKKDFPSIGFMLENGATTLWEQYDGDNSRNHPVHGAGLTWFQKGLCGIDTDPDAPGFRHFTVKPNLPSSFTSASYSTVTPYGKLSSDVARTADGFRLEIRVPVGCTATITLPSGNVEERGQGNWTLTDKVAEKTAGR